jgi:hypothetical protein
MGSIRFQPTQSVHTGIHSSQPSKDSCEFVCAAYDEGMFRVTVIASMLCVAASAATAQDAPAPPPLAGSPPPGRMTPPPHFGGRVFLSPMGQPFRSLEGEPEPQDKWFDATDADRDGAISFAEFQQDATRFFAMLDVRKDGEIDPDDIERYETAIAPEVRAGFGPGGGRGQRPAKSSGFGSSVSTGSNIPRGSDRVRPPEQAQGAARFSYFSYPEPVTVADRNFNRGVDPREFARAAETRFDLLDANHDGKIARDELPAFEARMMTPGRRRPPRDTTADDAPPPQD